MARKPAHAALLACILLSLAGGCRDASGPTHKPARYSSLTLGAEVDPGAVIEVWKGEGDRRITLVQQAPEPLQLAPIPAGEGCMLHFGVAFDREHPPVGPIPLAIRAGSTVVFREEVDPAGVRWTDREVVLPAVDEIALVFEADVSQPTPVGWGSPRVVCTGGGAVFPARGDRPHIVVISIDTLRADHLGLYGYGRPTSPHLDAFAREATVFDLAFATSPWTLPSHASLLTGFYPDEHRAGHANVFTPLPSDVPTVAEILSNSGYRTIAHTGAGYVGRRYGLQRGFEQWTERSFASLDSALWEVLDQLDDDLDRPLLLFLHTYSTHAPYLHPSTFPSLRDEDASWPPESDPERKRWLSLGSTQLHRHLSLGLFRDLDDLIAAYDSTIRFVDAQLGILFEHLKQAGIYEQALIIVTSDHGETFLERGPYLSHGYSFFDEEIRVPLLVRMPGGRERGRSDRLVSLNDVAALILDVAGARAPLPISGTNPLAAEAIDPVSFVRGGSAFTGGQFARSRDWKVMTAIHHGGAKGMRTASELIPGFPLHEHVFEVRSDALEHSNLSGQPTRLPAEIWLMRQALGGVDPPGQFPPETEKQALSEQDREQLDALGYIEREKR